MKNQRVLIQHLKKYKSSGFYNFLHNFLQDNIKKYKETFIKNGHFKLVNDLLVDKNGKCYSNYVTTVSISQLAKDLGV